MARTMRTGAAVARREEQAATGTGTIQAALSPRLERESVDRELARIAAEREAVSSRYEGGLPAERQSAVRLLAQLDQSHRATVVSGMGRRIDLSAMMRQRRPDGSPAWAVVDPRREIGDCNGKHDTDGMIAWPGPRDGSFWIRMYPEEERIARAFIPLGMPALPPRIRDLVREVEAGGLASRVGVLYEPRAWIEAKPDPALVVEWVDRPGEFYALAVWGVDGPAIMEFVD